MKKHLTLTTILIVSSICLRAQSDGKVALGDPREDKVPLDEPKLESLAKEVKNLPDGVLKVKTNPDGSFKSLVVKATVEVEDVLGAEKGKRLGRKEAEINCKRLLSQWMKENCAFAEAQGKVTTIITKGESSKDAAGNKVTIRNQKAEEIKVNTEGYASASAAVLKGLTVLHSEVTDEKEYVLLMGLSQKGIDQANLVAGALSRGGFPSVDQNGKAIVKPTTDFPAPEKKTNPELEDFLK
jgi:hypothetical protein